MLSRLSRLSRLGWLGDLRHLGWCCLPGGVCPLPRRVVREMTGHWVGFRGPHMPSFAGAAAAVPAMAVTVAMAVSMAVVGLRPLATVSTQDPLLIGLLLRDRSVSFIFSHQLLLLLLSTGLVRASIAGVVLDIDHNLRRSGRHLFLSLFVSFPFTGDPFYFMRRPTVWTTAARRGRSLHRTLEDHRCQMGRAPLWPTRNRMAVEGRPSSWSSGFFNRVISVISEVLRITL